MARNFLNRFFSREGQSDQSMIQPNDALNLKDLSKYTQVITNKETEGYMGLRRAFENGLTVTITVKDEALGNIDVTGTISHYDDNYDQLLVIVNSQLKRVVFDSIVEVKIQEAE
ncbi:MAG TPA: hypothetical protein DCY20_11810 [Firmicutes bacterium]|nr:hypothetical protein [Bacillota bacterium]